MAAIKHNGLSHAGSCSSSNSGGSRNGSVMGDCHVHDGGNGGDSSATANGFEWVGAPCGQHGTSTFYKAVKCASRVLALGDFFFVKMWTDQEIVSIGELQLLWEDDKFGASATSNNGHFHHQPSSSSSSSPLASLKLYFLPENTPDGRHEEHGEDEVVSISEKVVLKVSDLVTWLVDDVKWEKGAAAVWERHCTAPAAAGLALPPPPDCGADGEEAGSQPLAANTTIGVLDMRDVIKEKEATGDVSQGSNVIVLSYPAYCRYRSTLKRLEGHNYADYMRQAVVEAIGGRPAPLPNTRVVFCKDTFDYPELEDHELLCNHLAPKWKGRPRKMRKKRSHSPGSESNESESSVSTVTSSSRSKDSPMKPGIRNVPTPYRAGDRPKGEQAFMQKLHKFMAGRGTPIGRLPSLGFKQLDLFLFYTKVQRNGGYEAAVTNKLWKGIYIELGGHPSNTSAATCTRRHYEKLLLPYEQYVLSLAAEESAASAGTSAATPPKKRKISDASDLPFEPAAAPPEHVDVDEEDKQTPPPLLPSNGGNGADAGRMDRLRIVESVLPQTAAEETNSKSPKIVESPLPGSVIVRHPLPPPLPPPPPPPTETPDDGANHSEPEVVILSHPPSASQPLASSKVAVRSDLTRPSAIEDSLSTEVSAEMRDRLKAVAESSNLNLPGLMAAGSDPAQILTAALAAAAASGDAKQLSALGDLARFAHHLESSAVQNKMKESKLINPANHSKEADSGHHIRRPSVIQKNVIDGKVNNSAKNSNPPTSSSTTQSNTGPPPPAHSQKPLTLPNIPAGGVPASEQLRQWYAQMLSDKATGGNPLPASAAAMLELTMRPPTPAAATPSIFVPSRCCQYPDPNLDIRKNNMNNNSSNSKSQTVVAGSPPIAAHSKSAMAKIVVPSASAAAPPPAPSSQNITPPRPMPLPSSGYGRGNAGSQPVTSRPSSAIPLVDLTSRSVNNVKQEDHPHHSIGRKSSTGLSGHGEMNGKPLLDLSANQHHLLQQHQHKIPASVATKQWNASPRSGGGDVSISVNVKIEGGSESKPNLTGASGSSGHQQHQQQQRHSVSVVPVMKEEPSAGSRHRKEKEIIRAQQQLHQQQQQQQHQQQQLQQQQQQQQQSQTYPRMVDSLVMNSAASSSAGVTSVTKSGSAMAAQYGGSSSSSSSSSKPNSSNPSAGLHSGYPALLDPALASYYSSLYNSHMYNLPAGAFMAAAAAQPQLHHPSSSSVFHHHHHHQQMVASSAAAEVTAQVYKDMIQRGYPPALAPVLPPGLSGLPGLSSLGSFAASMYSPMGGSKDSSSTERSLPKS